MSGCRRWRRLRLPRQRWPSYLTGREPSASRRWSGSSVAPSSQPKRKVDDPSRLYEVLRQNQDCGGRPALWSRAGEREAKVKKLVLGWLFALVFALPAGATTGGTNGLLAYQAQVGKHTQLFTIKPDGSGSRQIT